MSFLPRTRGPVAAVLIGLGLVASPLALAAHSGVELVDNSEYVTDSLEGLIDDPVVQDQLVDQALEPLTSAFTSEAVIDLFVDLGTIPEPLTGSLGDLANPLIQPLIDSLVSQIETTAAQIVASDAFAESWRTAVGDSHRAFQDALREGENLTIELPLRPFLELVRDDLADSGFPGLERLPIPDVSTPLFTVEPSEAWQERYQLASLLDPWLALAAIGFIGAGVWFSPRRQSAWVAIGIGIPVLTLGPVLAVQWWLSALPASLPTTAGLALITGPQETAATVSVVVVLISAVGWFIERSRKRAIT